MTWLGLGIGPYVTNSNRKVRISGEGGLGFYVTNSDRRARVGDRVIFTNHIPVVDMSCWRSGYRG